MTSLLTVIIPVYNVEQYLDRCIRSIVNQTYKNIEVILVDDGSTDKCPLICDDWAKRDSRIKVIHKENGGISSARNVGLDLASGNLLSFIDGDDYISTFMFEDMIQVLEGLEADIVCCGRFRKDDMQEIELLNDAGTLQCFSASEAIGNLLMMKNINEASWDKIYKVHLFSNLRFPLGEVNEDIVIMPRIFSQSNKIVHIGKSYYYYWQSKNGVTKSVYSDRQTVVPKHMEMTKEYIYNNFPELKGELSCFLARYSLDMLENLVSCGENITKKYETDYQYYMSNLKNNLISLLKSNSFDLKFKIKGILMVAHLYVPIKKIVNLHL